MAEKKKKKMVKPKETQEQSSEAPKEHTSKQINIDKDLKQIYQLGKGRLPNMTKLEFKKQTKLITFFYVLIPVLVVLVFVSWLGFFFFQRTPSFTGSNVSLDIAAPFTVTSGEIVQYTITIQNQEDTAINDNLLTVRLPNGFIFDSASLAPIPSNNDEELFKYIKTWKINSIDQDRKFSLIISGKLYGEPGDTQVISATLDYNPTDFSSTFQENTAFTSEITETFLTVDTSGSKQVADGEETEYIVVVTNTHKEEPFSNVQLSLKYPEDFTPTKWFVKVVDLNGDGEDLLNSESITDELSEFDKNEDLKNSWDFEQLDPNNAIYFILKGIYKVKETSEIELGLTVAVQGNDKSYITQQEEAFVTEIIKGELLTQLIIQGNDGDKPINFGDTLNYFLTIQNKSKSTLSNVEVRAVLDSPLLDWGSLVDENNGEVDEPQILWTKDEIDELDIMFPSSEITIPFSIRIIGYDEISRKINLDDFRVRSFFESKVGLIDNIEVKKKFDSHIITNPINSNFELAVEARYFDNKSNPIGSGPLPPVVGQKTTYAVFWKLSNSLHELSNIRVTAKLPEGVSFEREQNLSTGSIFLNGDEVVWEINRLPDSIPSVTAQFEVSITPESSDVEKILSILSETFAEAKDTATTGEIIQATSGLTTNLDNDPLAENKGLVQDK